MFDDFGNIVERYGDFRIGREGGGVVVSVFVQSGTAAWRGKVRRELLLVGCG